MNSPDSWIDLQEIAKLVRQILPEDEAGPSTASPSSAWPAPGTDAPGSLFASPEESVPPWQILPENMDENFPDLDDLPLPSDPDILLTQDTPLPELRSRAENALRAVQPFTGRDEAPGAPRAKDGNGDVSSPTAVSAKTRRTGETKKKEETEEAPAAEPEAAGGSPEPDPPESKADPVPEGRDENPGEAEGENPGEAEGENPGEAEGEEPAAAIEGDDTPGSQLEDYQFHMPDGPLRLRLRAYVEWVRGVTGCHRLMLSDGQGYSLLQKDDLNDPTVVGSALSLMDALAQMRHRMDASSARSGLYIPLDEQEWFGVLECNSSLGHVCLSMVTQAPLAKTAAEQLIQTLQATLDA